MLSSMTDIAPWRYCCGEALSRYCYALQYLQIGVRDVCLIYNGYSWAPAVHLILLNRYTLILQVICHAFVKIEQSSINTGIDVCAFFSLTHRLIAVFKIQSIRSLNYQLITWLSDLSYQLTAITSFQLFNLGKMWEDVSEIASFQK